MIKKKNHTVLKELGPNFKILGTQLNKVNENYQKSLNLSVRLSTNCELHKIHFHAYGIYFFNDLEHFFPKEEF